MIPMKAYLKGSRLLAGKLGLFWLKHDTDILIYGGIATIVAGAALTGKGTLEAVNIVNDYKEEMNKAKDKPAKAKATGKCAWRLFRCFAGAAGAIVLGTGMICVGKKRLDAKYLGAQALYALTNETLERYRDDMKDVVGEEKEKEIYERIKTEVVEEENEKGKKVKHEVKTPAGSGHPLEFIFDERNLKYKKYEGNNWFVLMQARKACNNILNSKGYITLAEVLENIGMPVPTYAFDCGWIREPGNPQKIIFGFEDDLELRYASNQCILLKFNCDPDFKASLPVIMDTVYGYRCDIA